MALTKESILKADDLKRELVAVPEWGGEVYVRTMTGSERDDFESSMMDKKGRSRADALKNIRARLCVLCLVSDGGEQIFTKTDVDALSKKSAAALDRVFTKAQKLNGLSGEDVEELAKS